MRRSIFILLITLSCTDTTQAQWGQLPPNTGKDLHAIYFINESLGFVVGDSGIILRTSNGGGSWDSLPSGTTKTLNDVFFLDANTGFVVGMDTTYLETTNGGNSWQPKSATGQSAAFTVTIFSLLQFSCP